MLTLDLAASLAGAMNDPEFSREMRYFTGKLKLDIDGAVTVATFNDGSLESIDANDVPDEQCEIWIRGGHDLWEGMLAEYPVPFFQCLQTTNIKHGLELSTTNQSFAYLPALNRLVSLLRAENTRSSL